jgi:hypothetical protein
VNGINLLEKPEGLPVFQALLASELNGGKKTAVWIDARNEASTYALRHQGGPEILEKVDIGRAFTPLQHHDLIHQLEEFIGDSTEVLVIPNVDFFYTDGQLSDWEAQELFQETWEKIKEIQSEYGLKVLLSLHGPQKLDHNPYFDIENDIEVKSTDEGLKYQSDDFDQYAYRDGNHIQTMIPYWKEKSSDKVQVKTEVRQ